MWDNILVTENGYNAGLIGLNLIGQEVNSETRYKWISFKLNKETNTQYSFNNTVYNVLNSGEYDYLSIKSMLTANGLFDATTVSNLFNETNEDAIGFCRATKATGGNTVVGNFKQGVNQMGGIWSQYGTANTGYTSSKSVAYGAKVVNGSDYGIFIAPTAINNDLQIFIGLKN